MHEVVFRYDEYTMDRAIDALKYALERLDEECLSNEDMGRAASLSSMFISLEQIQVKFMAVRAEQWEIGNE